MDISHLPGQMNGTTIGLSMVRLGCVVSFAANENH